MKTHAFYKQMLVRTAIAAVATGISMVNAQPVQFKDADLALGEQLVAQHKCSQCHIGKVGGDGRSIYNPAGRINEAGLLRGMVDQCNSTLNLQMFPEEVTAVAAVLNRDHYHFKK